MAHFVQTYQVLGIAGALVLTLLLPLAIGTVTRFFKLATTPLETHPQRFPNVTFRGLELVKGAQLAKTLLHLLRAIYTFALVLITYAYFSIVFSFFDQTRGITKLLLQFVFQIIGSFWALFVAYLPNLFSILMIVFVSYHALKIIRLLLTAISEGKLLFKGFHKDWAEPTYSIVRFLTILFVLVMVFPLLPGFDSPAFKGISVFLGVLLSLGSTGAIANVIAGIVLIYMRSFEVGDRIETNQIMGDVIEKTLLVTRLKTINNEEVTIPNSAILANPTINYTNLSSKGDGLVLHTNVTIGYDTPWRQVHQLLQDAAAQTDLILDRPEPQVYQTALDDFYVRYELRAYTKHPHKMAQIYSDLHQHIQDQFAAAHVEIMSPHYRANRQGPITIPS
ncbi:MAG: mechanosensitive ion channel family protein [Cyanobacteria bacterium HKST-UBA04]|nr:mechanosensitive ion channel family protein [Cyanobacteria bacterium HKST-UBA04]MCA9842661.1 mechanosensitive ion channel family protein [Cyanobacteria bacterium HKST-UBA03]